MQKPGLAYVFLLMPIACFRGKELASKRIEVT